MLKLKIKRYGQVPKKNAKSNSTGVNKEKIEISPIRKSNSLSNDKDKEKAKDKEKSTEKNTNKNIKESKKFRFNSR